MRTFLIALGGAVVGASAACLLWAEPCASTRKLIKDKSTELAHDLSHSLETKSQALTEKARNLAHQSEEFVEHGKEFVHRAQEIIEQARDKVKKVEDAVAHGHDAADKARLALAAAHNRSIGISST